MIIRIVRMTFHPEHVPTFEQIFDESRLKIIRFDGCTKVELLQDVNHSNVFMTYSYWASEAQLDAYRHSELFRGTWSKTKQLFSEKPQAWSLEKRNEA